MRLHVSARPSAGSGVIEAISPNYFQPLPKIFRAICESLSWKILHADGKASGASDERGKGSLRWLREAGECMGRLGVLCGAVGCCGVPRQHRGSPGQHRHSPVTSPIPSNRNKNGCKMGIFGCLPFPPFSDLREDSGKKNKCVKLTGHSYSGTFQGKNEWLCQPQRHAEACSLCSHACNKAGRSSEIRFMA